MYEIRPETAKSFVTDRSIHLPRFQRKQTWDYLKNFLLCISVFKGYPLGVCIINKENSGTSSKKVLLDGRQRRNALTQMFENPDIIGLWAKKFLKVSQSIDSMELEGVFDESIEKYLESDEDDIAFQSESSTEDDTGAVDWENENEETSVKESSDGIGLLRQIVALTYKRLKHYTSFTAPFDFSKLIANLPFCDSDENNAYVINGKKVKSFFIEYQRHCEDNNIEYDENSEYFADYLISRGSLKDGITKDKVKNVVQKKWAEILVRFGIFEKMDSIMSNCKIGIIEVQGFKPADSQKIFYIINSEGVKLTAAEILSAKSYWNKKIQNPSAEMVSATNTLYTAMGIRVEDVYRWDIPATLLERLGDNVVFQKLSWDSINKKTEFEKKLTLGFKTMAGVYKKAVTKEHLDEMGRDNSIDWSIEAENTIKDLKAVIKLIEETTYFRYLKTWKTSIMELTSDAIALDFILIMYFDYIRKEKPYGAGTRTKQFQRNCFILWDSLIYEYVRKMWRGSSDSLIANNIRELSNKDDVFSPVEKEKWIDLLQEIYERSTVNETNVSVSLMKPILYHMYCLQNIAGPNDMGVTVEVDHIIPQSEFKSSTIPNKDVIKDNLYNLGLLPKKENVSKSNHKLKHIDDEWLISQIETYEFVEQNMFEKFSSVSGYKGLFEYKKKKFDEAFGTMEEGNRSKRDVQLID